MSNTKPTPGRTDIMELEEGDIVFINNKHGYCEVKEVGISFHGPITLTLQHTELFRGENVFQKTYNSNKTFKLYE